MESVLGSELYSTLHDRERRDQRMIGKDDQLKARRYGMCEQGRNGRLKYTYNNKVLIWCPRSNRAITCWNIRGNDCGMQQSGTSKTDPILIQKSLTHENDLASAAHEAVKWKIRKQKDKWTSHTVLVVDMSGSMRTDDVDGARCRSDGVWTCLARDFIKSQVEEGKTSLHDLVSVVLMRETAEVILECEPSDYVLYNKLVDLREWAHHRPSGPGNYEPALEQAELLLNKNLSGSCAVTLFFFSDGRPSDPNKHDIPAKMGAMASRFGRRLTVHCVGMANHETEDFSILEKMVQETKAYGAIGFFNKPSMTADSLSQIISSQVTSSLTSTKTELTNLSSGKAMTVRTDLVRERHNAPDDLAPTSDWRLFNNDSQYTLRVWTWNHKGERGNGGFSRLIDPRCLSCFVNVMDTTTNQANPERGMLCNNCKACFFCWGCIRNRSLVYQRHIRTSCYRHATSRRQGALMPLKESIPSFSVAWKKKCFGEGAERVAFKFRFLDENGAFTGPKMVAKESRFVQNEGTHQSSEYLTTDQHKYHKDFMRTQFLASKFATKFNDTLQEWEDHLRLRAGHNSSYRDQCLFHKERIHKYPRIRFLQPRIFELRDDEEGKTFNVLAEPMIEGDYRKYNTNNGGLANFKFESPCLQTADHDLNPRLVTMLLGSRDNNNTINESAASLPNQISGVVGAGLGGNDGLGAIVEEEEEGSEEEEEDEDEAVDVEEGFGQPRPSEGGRIEVFERIVQEGNMADRDLSSEVIPDEDFMQAFSHFSYVRSGGRLIVVDLQGALDVRRDGSREFVLTDPAIHKRKYSRVLKHMNFGRTDRGDKGIHNFFETHTCNNACRLLGLRPRPKKHSLTTQTAVEN